MGNIKETLSLVDNFSSPMKSVERILMNTSNQAVVLNKNLTRAMGKSSGAVISEIRSVNSQIADVNRRIDTMIEKQNKYTDSVSKSNREAGGLVTTLRRAATVIAGFTAAKGITGLSDQMAQIQARLKMIKDESQTLEQLNQMIFQSAQRARAPYQETADAIAKMGLNAGNAFSSNQELIAFMEAINKQFAISGAGAQETAGAMLQLTQAMGAGALRGEELNSILDAAPGIARNIEKYMGWASGSIKSYAEQGLVTAQVVKNAMITSLEDINDQIGEMPITFGQAVTMVKNKAVIGFKPLGDAISAAINSPKFQTALDSLSQGIYIFTSYATKAFTTMANIVGKVADNWYWLGPIIGGGTTAIIAYKTAVSLANLATTAFSVASTLAKAAAMLQTTSVMAATKAQYGLNSAMWACPITWIVGGVILIVAAIIAGVKAFNHFGQTGNTVLGTIAALFLGAGAVILNFWGILANGAISAAEWVVNTWNTAVYNVQTFFYNLAVGAVNSFNSVVSAADGAATAIANAFISGANKAISGINWVISALNKLPGFDIDKMGEIGQVDSVMGGFKISAEGIKAPEAPTTVSFDRFNTTSAQEAYLSGWNLGSNLGNNLTKKVTSGIDGIKNEFNNLTNGLEGLDVSKAIAGLTDQLGNDGKQNVGSVDRVKSVEGSVNLSDEDLKLYRDLAERKYMANVELQTLAPNINISIPESAAKNLTAQDIADKLKTILIQQSASHTAVSHG